MDTQSRSWPRPQYFHSSSSSPSCSPRTIRIPSFSNIPDVSAYREQQWGDTSRDDLTPQCEEFPVIKQESIMQPVSSQLKSEGSGNGIGEESSSLPSTSDFVKKLYKMLEDPSFQHIVCWGPHGDCFIVKDMNEFTKSVLPRLFKHSNFASFVRQLNKYDFHKVKSSEDGGYGGGEHSWTFRHPDFHVDRPDALENIRRKVPSTSRKSQQSQNLPPSPSLGYPPSPGIPLEVLQSQVDRLTRAQEETAAHIRSLERNYHEVLVEMVGFQRNMAQQDGLMQNLIQYLLQAEASGPNSYVEER